MYTFRGQCVSISDISIKFDHHLILNISDRHVERNLSNIDTNKEYLQQFYPFNELENWKVTVAKLLYRMKIKRK